VRLRGQKIYGVARSYEVDVRDDNVTSANHKSRAFETIRRTAKVESRFDYNLRLIGRLLKNGWGFFWNAASAVRIVLLTGCGVRYHFCAQSC
jgi:hypothetical protein